jgi:aminopeptidase N
MRLEYYVFPNNFDAVQNTYGLTKDMIGAMADRFGEYPFIKEKYGHAEFVWGGGMEHQTLTSLGGYSEGLIAHELGHQWWGDMVTCANFHHIWLNEGFATYSEALWYEKRDNDIQSLHDAMEIKKARYNFAPGTIFVEDTTSISAIFSSRLSYNKASWVLHMLRHIVGDETFFNGIKEFGIRYRFKSAVTEQFQEVMEETSGKDLDSFFQRWIYDEYYPIYEVVYSQSDNNLLIQISQVQNSAIFEMPIDIKATFVDESTSTWVVENSSRQDYFSMTIPDGKTIQRLELDPDNWILKKISEIRLDTLGNTIFPKGFYLHPVYPNPFNAGVTIRFDLENEGEVQLNIFDISGNQVWQKTGNFVSGTQFIKWNGKNQLGNVVPSGTYVVELNNGTLVKTRKMLLLK